MMTRAVRWAAALALMAAPPAFAVIDTTLIEQPWPKQRVQETEVGRYPVRWRQHASKQAGIFAGVRFRAPLARPQVWDLANDYTDIGTKTPGVTAVRFLERQPTRQVIQLDVKVLWKKLQLNFEVEQDPPSAVRFRLVNRALGEYRGVCVFRDAGGETGPAASTDVELATWLKPSRPVPMHLLLMVERMTLLQGAAGFLKTCEQHAPRSGPPAASAVHR